jgi:predicted ATP-grasp superfamily ATP-dependent carboligase
VGLEVPPERAFSGTEELLAAAPELDFPVVVKPRTRRYLAFRADRPADLERVPEDGGPLVVQPFVTEPLHAVSGVLSRGRLVAAAHERWLRIWPYPCGLACAAETVRADPDVERRLTALLKDHEGLFCAQFAGPYIFDVNLRIHSSHPLAVAAGANLVGLWCDLAAGREVSEVRARPGHFYRWLEGDLRHVAQAVRSGRMSLPEAARALRPRADTAHSTESLLDPGPMLSRLWYSARRAHLSPERRRLASGLAGGKGVPRAG